MKGKMKAIVKEGAGKGAVLKIVEIPQIKSDEVLVKVHAASICGSDMHIYNWDPWAKAHMTVPVTIGHEFSGEIVEIGDGIKSLKVGDIISSETHFVCGHCEQCRTNKANICSNTVILGINVNGAFAEYVAIPEKAAWKNEVDTDPAYLAIQEPLGNAVHTILSGDTVGRSIAVVGCGPVGMLAIPVAAKSGAKQIIAVEPNEYRASLAKKLGAHVIINPVKENVVEVVKEVTGGCGIDVVAEMSGNPTALQIALKYIKPGGRISLLGIAGENIELDIANDIIFKGVTLQGIIGRTLFENWYTVKGLIESKDFNLQPVVTHRFKLEDYEQAFKLMGSGNSGKIALYPHENIFKKFAG